MENRHKIASTSNDQLERGHIHSKGEYIAWRIVTNQYSIKWILISTYCILLRI